MIKTYTGLRGFSVFLVFIAGITLFLFVSFWGMAKVIELFLPVVIVLSYLLIIVFVLGFLPAAFVKDLRPYLGVYSLLMSHTLSVATWIMAFFFVVKAFGFWGILLALLFQFLVPVALVGAMLKGTWHIAEHLSIWVCFTYGMRFYNQWLLKLNPQDQGKRDIIDVDAIEV